MPNWDTAVHFLVQRPHQTFLFLFFTWLIVTMWWKLHSFTFWYQSSIVCPISTILLLSHAASLHNKGWHFVFVDKDKQVWKIELLDESTQPHCTSQFSISISILQIASPFMCEIITFFFLWIITYGQMMTFSNTIQFFHCQKKINVIQTCEMNDFFIRMNFWMTTIKRIVVINKWDCNLLRPTDMNLVPRSFTEIWQDFTTDD